MEPTPTASVVPVIATSPGGTDTIPSRRTSSAAAAGAAVASASTAESMTAVAGTASGTVAIADGAAIAGGVMSPRRSVRAHIRAQTQIPAEVHSAPLQGEDPFAPSHTRHRSAVVLSATQDDGQLLSAARATSTGPLRLSIELGAAASSSTAVAGPRKPRNASFTEGASLSAGNTPRRVTPPGPAVTTGAGASAPRARAGSMSVSPTLAGPGSPRSQVGSPSLSPPMPLPLSSSHVRAAPSMLP